MNARIMRTQRALFVVTAAAGLVIGGCSAASNPGSTPSVTQGSGGSASARARQLLIPCNTLGHPKGSCTPRPSPSNDGGKYGGH